MLFFLTCIMEILEKKRVDEMVCGMFKNKSYFGKRSSVLKSGVCKYFRREEFDKYEWCVIEMFIFGLKNKGLMTNIENRLKILIFENMATVFLLRFQNLLVRNKLNLPLKY